MEAFVYKPLPAPLRVICLAAGTIFLAIGLIAIFLPVLPTTEFVILAAICYARSSQTLHRWLTTRPWLQPYFNAARHFKEKRELPLRVKVMACGCSWLSCALLFSGLLRGPRWAAWLALGLAVACTVFMLRVKTARD